MVDLVKIPARDFLLEIDENYGTTDAPSWLPIKGLTSLAMSPKTTQTDTTDFDSEGISEHMPMERGKEFSCSGFYLEDLDTGERDPGQEAVEALGDRVGPAGIGSMRLTSPGGNRWSFHASAEVTSPGGGGNNDMSSFNVKFTVTGPTEQSAAS